MSGTSLDGIDVCHASFWNEDEQWMYKIHQAETLPYSSQWKHRLQKGLYLSDVELQVLDKEYGQFLGEVINDFLIKHHVSPQLIASHGHTIRHRPERGITFQAGCGIEIFRKTGRPVVYDFRSEDVSLGGQGAPLVPVGDHFLFSDYEYCLNLGGISNISMMSEGKRVAWDISPCNMILNAEAQKMGYPYDPSGNLAKSGEVITTLLNQFNQLNYYRIKPPKSLGREKIELEFAPFIKSSRASLNDVLRTFTEHIAIQVSKAIVDNASERMLVTGGGAFNTFLVERISHHVKARVEVPGPSLVNYKEALIFAFLGILRWRNEVNVFSSVTGASRDSVSGKLVSKKTGSQVIL